MATKRKHPLFRNPVLYSTVDLMNIDINMDSIVVNGQTLQRPDRISRSAWIDFWERAKGDSE